MLPRRSLTLVCALTVLATAWPGTAVASQGVPAPGAGVGPGWAKPDLSGSVPEAIGGKLLVQFEPGTGRSERSRAHAVAGGRVVSRVRSLRVDVVRVPPGRSAQALLERYLADPAVRFAEPNVPRTPAGLPDDPNFSKQWGLHNTGQSHPVSDPPPQNASGKAGADVDAPQAWDALVGTGEAVVAVIDTGVAHGHADLASRMWTNLGEIPANGLDDDGNGYTDDVFGYDFKQDDGDPAPGGGPADVHGTHVAGIVAAEVDNARGIAGVCDRCRIMALRFGLDLASEIEAIEYAVDNGADIINASYSGSFWSNIERAAIRRAGKAGVLFVGAAGNEAGDNDMLLPAPKGGAVPTLSPQFPASYDLATIVSVAASNHRDEYGYLTGCQTDLPKWRCLFTNWGHESVDLAAPGVDVMSTVPNGYNTFSGTSMAAPMVAGVAGLIVAEHGYGPVRVKNALMNGTDHPTSMRRLPLRGGPYRGRFTKSAGRLDARKALTASPDAVAPRSDGTIRGARLLKRIRTGKVSWPNDVNDVFKKRLRRGVRYEVTLDGARGRDLDLWVWKPGTKEIWQVSAGCFALGGSCPIVRFSTSTTADETVRFRAAENGVYYVHVTSFFSTGAYTLRIRRR